MTANLARSYLRFGLTYVAEQSKLIDHSLVCVNVQEHGGAPAMLRQNDRLAGFLYLIDDLSCPGAEFSDRLDITTWLELGHAALPEKSVPCNVPTGMAARNQIARGIAVAGANSGRD